jgi:hypothetical protein
MSEKIAHRDTQWHNPVGGAGAREDTCRYFLFALRAEHSYVSGESVASGAEVGEYQLRSEIVMKRNMSMATFRHVTILSQRILVFFEPNQSSRQ